MNINSTTIDDISIMFHKMLYPLLKLIFKSVRRHKFVYLNKMPGLTSNAIFAVNHSCKYDIPYACEAIGKHCFVLVGKQPLNFIDRLVFMINGVIWVDRKNKENRHNSIDSMVNILNKNGNILLFPEGTRNLSPSKPMLPLYWGVIDVARYAQVPIVPVVLEFSNSECYVSFGECIFVEEKDDKSAKINELNDAFATLKWKLWEKFSSLGYDSEEEYMAEMTKRINEYPKMNMKYEMSVIRNISNTEQNVFKPLLSIELNHNTAFLAKTINDIRSMDLFKFD